VGNKKRTTPAFGGCKAKRKKKGEFLMRTLKEFMDQTLGWGEKHFSVIMGLGAMLFGITLAYIAREVVINLIVFTCGLFLIYYGLVKLKLKKVTDAIDQIISKLRY
jgi:hypothetical protein